MTSGKPLVWLHGEVKLPPLLACRASIDSDAIVVLEVFQKKARATPKQVMEIAKKQLRTYQRVTRED